MRISRSRCGATSHVSRMPDSQFWLVRFVKAAAAGSPCLFGDTWIRNFRVDEGGHAVPGWVLMK